MLKRLDILSIQLDAPYFSIERHKNSKVECIFCLKQFYIIRQCDQVAEDAGKYEIFILKPFNYIDHYDKKIYAN